MYVKDILQMSLGSFTYAKYIYAWHQVSWLFRSMFTSITTYIVSDTSNLNAHLVAISSRVLISCSSYAILAYVTQHHAITHD